MKDGVRIMDSDMHIIEPGELWEKYIDEHQLARAPGSADRGVIGGVVGTVITDLVPARMLEKGIGAVTVIAGLAILFRR